MNPYQFLGLLGTVAWLCERSYWAGIDDSGAEHEASDAECVQWAIEDAFVSLHESVIRTGGLHR